MDFDINEVRAAIRNGMPPFEIRKIGHVVLMVSDLKRSVEFYTGVLGSKVSDIFEKDLMPQGMVFLRCNPDHHGIALVGGAPGPTQRSEFHHMAFELGTLDEVFRARQHLRDAGAEITFEGRRRAGVQVAVEFLDPDGYTLELYWGIDQIGTDGYVRPKEEWRGADTLEEAIAHPPPGQVAVLFDRSLLDHG
jgi:catechol 2,3-dioxygenase-like lactoylglutathione lyase family enzyme